MRPEDLKLRNVEIPVDNFKDGLMNSGISFVYSRIHVGFPLDMFHGSVEKYFIA